MMSSPPAMTGREQDQWRSAKKEKNNRQQHKTAPAVTLLLFSYSDSWMLLGGRQFFCLCMLVMGRS